MSEEQLKPLATFGWTFMASLDSSERLRIDLVSSSSIMLGQDYPPEPVIDTYSDIQELLEFIRESTIARIADINVHHITSGTSRFIQDPPL